MTLRLDLGSNLGLELVKKLDLDLGLGFELGFSKVNIETHKITGELATDGLHSLQRFRIAYTLYKNG